MKRNFDKRTKRKYANTFARRWYAPDHRTQFLYYFQSVLLHSHGRSISARMSIHRAYNSSDRRLFVVTSRRMSNICSQKYNWLVEYLRTQTDVVNRCYTCNETTKQLFVYEGYLLSVEYSAQEYYWFLPILRLFSNINSITSAEKFYSRFSLGRIAWPFLILYHRLVLLRLEKHKKHELFPDRYMSRRQMNRLRSKQNKKTVQVVIPYQ